MREDALRERMREKSGQLDISFVANIRSLFWIAMAVRVVRFVKQGAKIDKSRNR